MKADIYCPNTDCPNHKNPPSEIEWFCKKGFTFTKRSGRTQRLQCKECKRTFALSYFSINHYVHRRVSVRKLLQHLVSGSGIRDMGRAMHCHPCVIQHRIRELSRRIMAVCSQEAALLELKEDIAADGLENFILSQFFPTYLNILVGHDSQFIYTFNSYYFKRKGSMTEEQRRKKEELYKEANFEKGAASLRFREILDYLAAKAKESNRKSFILDTDENPIYQTQFIGHPDIAMKISHRKTNSKKERNMNNCMDRFTCYSFWHNFNKPFRINPGKSNFKFHAQAAGFSLEKISEIVSEVFYGIKRKKDVAGEYLTDFQKRHWERNLVNPLSRMAV